MTTRIAAILAATALSLGLAAAPASAAYSIANPYSKTNPQPKAPVVKGTLVFGGTPISGQPCNAAGIPGVKCR